jgi:hypothetical protein
MPCAEEFRHFREAPFVSLALEILPKYFLAQGEIAGFARNILRFGIRERSE